MVPESTRSVKVAFAACADDADDETGLAPAIRARIAVVDESAQRNLDAINVRLMPRMPGFNAAMHAILDSHLSMASKFVGLWKLADDMMALNGENVACKRGCSHCCHIAVAIMPQEAQVIGSRIRRTPRDDVKLRASFADFDFGYHNPCTFLKEGECSIYANRPLACRVHYSLDVDALLCKLHPPATTPVPFLNSEKFHLTAMHIANVQYRDTLADIREYFPRRNGTGT
ncbi:putative zinc- or iron-chelating protein [Paraburkholderia sp. BL8N3]|nr:YkgJ family cysteine cluster protein [Paraburkholderia sp. BL8N3]TCK36703.1 putative zinc- or iron-chelating protein [Paraburkholderia sp. BL8N3]